MKYMGSKSRIAKYIVPILQGLIDKNRLQVYAEPFVGGANIIDKIQCNRRIAGDAQTYLIALYDNLDKVPALPDFVTRDHYQEVQRCYRERNGAFPDWYIGAIGFLASYNGKFFDGGYAKEALTKTGTRRNYYQEGLRNLVAQAPRLHGVEFLRGDYRQTCDHLDGALIYCDPPYQGTTAYASAPEFYHEEFWDWCRYMSDRNIVLVSEQQARDDFVCIWERPVTRTLNNAGRATAPERLFCYCETPASLFSGIQAEGLEVWGL